MSEGQSQGNGSGFIKGVMGAGGLGTLVLVAMWIAGMGNDEAEAIAAQTENIIAQQNLANALSSQATSEAQLLMAEKEYIIAEAIASNIEAGTRAIDEGTRAIAIQTNLTALWNFFLPVFCVAFLVIFAIALLMFFKAYQDIKHKQQMIDILLSKMEAS